MEACKICKCQEGCSCREDGFFLYAFRAADKVKIGMTTNIARRASGVRSQLRAGPVELIFKADLCHLEELRGAERKVLRGLAKHKLRGEVFSYFPGICKRLQSHVCEYDRNVRRFWQPVWWRKTAMPKIKTWSAKQ